MKEIPLTSLSHGGGCGCKISPSVLDGLLSGIPFFKTDELIVGPEFRDDAAVYRISDDTVIVATTDFFMPVVDDGETFGRIAAANAISDIYAMGASPLFALSITALPVKKLSNEQMSSILNGGMSICREAGIPLAGGHSIDSEEPIYGLAVVGSAHPDHIKTNAGALPGDVIIAGKPIGIGILSHVLKNKKISSDAYNAMVKTACMLNKTGVHFGKMPGVHAMTDVTGFGLAGHLLEICRASGTGAEISFSEIPWISEAFEYAESGEKTGASGRNRDSYFHQVETFAECKEWQKDLLADPQTSGGLLVCVSPENAEEALSLFQNDGFDRAKIIGKITERTSENSNEIFLKVTE